MLRDIDLYFEQQPEPIKSCMLALRHHILRLDPHLSEAWKYRMPFFCYNNKMCCYLWVHKQLRQPYLGIVEGKRINHPRLEMAQRARMKILLIDAAEDLPMDDINDILEAMLCLYR